MCDSKSGKIVRKTPEISSKSRSEIPPKSDKPDMNIAQLDYYFPFIVFFYGAIVSFTLSIPALRHIGETRMPYHFWKQLTMHRNLAMVCLIVGGLWSLQNMWFPTL
jgi:hypothetical protein